MSILVIEVTSEGMIFGSDRNVTSKHDDGTSDQDIQVNKVLKWSNDKALIGAVGNGCIGGLSTTDWLQAFIDRNIDFQTIKELGEKLCSEIQAQRMKDEGVDGNAKGMIVHLGGFAVQNEVLVPEIYLIANIHGIGKYGYEPADQNYGVSEEFWKYFPGVQPKEIRRALKVRAKNLEPFWFHQGIDLFTFNVLHESVKTAFKFLCTQHPNHDIPKSLAEWEKHVKMQILMYGSYFEAFHETGKRSVGGGVDVVSLAWPTN